MGAANEPVPVIWIVPAGITHAAAFACDKLIPNTGNAASLVPEPLRISCCPLVPKTTPL
jgi:hypothetical protein